jgi:hypothetical protein
MKTHLTIRRTMDREELVQYVLEQYKLGGYVRNDSYKTNMSDVKLVKLCRFLYTHDQSRWDFYYQPFVFEPTFHNDIAQVPCDWSGNYMIRIRWTDEDNDWRAWSCPNK